MGGLRISTLGGLWIELDGGPVTGFASAKAAALLVYLACNPYLHPREVLAELLWNERTQQRAQGNLRVVLSSLRKEVGDYVTINRERAGIDREADVWVDTTELEQATVAWRREASGQAAIRLTDALALYKGEFLAGVFLADAGGFELWATAERQRLHRLVVDGLEQLGAWHLEQEAHALAMETATQLLRIEPLSETGHRQLMEALARSGQRKEALAQYERSRQLLWEELGVEPAAATIELAEAIQMGQVEMAAKSIDAHRPAPIPVPATPLIGREVELAEIEALLRDSARLVSIVAPGGMGKTRLALEVANVLADDFGDGVAFVDLTSLSMIDGIAPAIAQSLQLKLEGSGIAPLAQLLDHLRAKELLLVLDNFEHLLEGTGILVEVLEAAPRVRLLTTSRERLRLQVEHIYPLQGLAVSGWETVEEAEQQAAVALFLHHVRRVRPGFVLRADHMPPLRTILQQLDGMPLAVILAATWLDVLSLAEIAVELEKSLNFLEAAYHDLPGRQQSMQAVFHTTWARLDEREQGVFAALSVFRGGFTLDAAREVARATPQELQRLVNRSLLWRAEGGRFGIHELLRQFAEEELARWSEREDAIRERHSVYYCRFLHEREAAFKSARTREVVAEINVEFENALAAWIWAADSGRLFLLEQAVLLGFYCAREGLREIAGAAFKRAVDRFKPTESARELRIQAFILILLGTFADTQGVNVRRKENIHEEALKRLGLAATLGEDVRYEEALALSILGQVIGDDDYLKAQSILERSLSLFQELHCLYEMAHVYHFLAIAHLQAGNYQEAYQYQSESVQLWQQIDDPAYQSQARSTLGYIKATLGQSEQAVVEMLEVIALLEAAAHPYMVAHAVSELGQVLIYLGRFEEAEAHLVSSASYMFRFAELDANSYYLRSNLCEAALHLGRFSEVWDEGQRLYDDFRRYQLTSGMALAAGLKGCAALALEDIGPAIEFLEMSVAENRAVERWVELVWLLGASACAAVLTGQQMTAMHQVLEALQLAKPVGLLDSPWQVLPAAALLFASRGEVERALELYALACQHPFVANSRWFEAVVGRRLAAVAETLPTEVVQAARERAAALDLWETVDRLLVELEQL